MDPALCMQGSLWNAFFCPVGGAAGSRRSVPHQPARPGDTSALPAPRVRHWGGRLGPVFAAAGAQGQELCPSAAGALQGGPPVPPPVLPKPQPTRARPGWLAAWGRYVAGEGSGEVSPHACPKQGTEVHRSTSFIHSVAPEASGHPLEHWSAKGTAHRSHGFTVPPGLLQAQVSPSEQQCPRQENPWQAPPPLPLQPWRASPCSGPCAPPLR